MPTSKLETAADLVSFIRGSRGRPVKASTGRPAFNKPGNTAAIPLTIAYVLRFIIFLRNIPLESIKTLKTEH